MKKKNVQCGFTVIEVVAAIFLLSACIVALSQLVAFVASQRVAEEIRQAAADQLQNVLEQLEGISNEKKVALDFDRSVFEATSKRAVPDGKVEFFCEPANLENDAVNSHVFRIVVSWNRGKNRPRGEVSMFRLLTLVGKGETEP